MSHTAYASPLVLEPGVSRYLISYLIVIHSLALVVVAAPLNLPAIFRFTLAVVIVISFVWQWRRTRLNDPAHIYRLVWEADDDWTLWCNDSTELVGQLRPESYESTWLVILRLQLQQGGRRTIVILPDMLDRQSFRRLRVRLRQARLAEAAEETGV
ncbi:MAG: hypothetical protein OEU74_06940 [Gammaproteobacteria bacterium]|nr:hypothetical protein [Gammaproteobacteria bacterium]